MMVWNRILLLGILSFALVFMQGNPVSAQFLNNEVPMWEGVKKSPADLENDKQLIKKVLELSDGDLDKGAKRILKLGWQFLGKGEPNAAIRRFNQAWLVKPDMPDLLWGYAIATHIRGDDLVVVEKWFDNAEKELPENAAFLGDRGRVLEERKLPEKAKAYFIRALELDPNQVLSHVGMMRIAEIQGETVAFEKHKAIVEKLTK